MTRARLAAAVLALAVCTPCVAEELDAAERAWARVCVENLASPSERVRGSAEAALALLGVDAIPTILESLDSLKTDDDWAALERALAGMGTKPAADALAQRTSSWPKPAMERLTRVLERLRGAKPAAPDAATAAVVRGLLATFEGKSSYGSDDEPRVRQIAAFGRKVVPVLLEELRGERRGFRLEATADAMALLATDDDLPALASLLADGHLTAAKCLRRLGGEQVVSALLVPVEKGRLSYELLEALGNHRSDPRVIAAVLWWVKRFGIDGSFPLGSAAEMLAEENVTEAIPLLVPLVDRGFQPTVHVRVAKALVDLGDKRGVPPLIDALERRGDAFDSWARHHAGEALNRVVGERIYSGEHKAGMGYSGNWKEAAGRFRAWWKASKDRLRFDASLDAWVVDRPR
jgi:HEAT repeat protein